MPLSLLNPWVILSLVGFFLVSTVGTGALMYMRGKDDMKAVYTEQELGKANKALVVAQKNNAIANAAGAQHETQVQVIRERGRDIIRTVTIPPDADPFMPVWFVRLWDRFASRSLTGDAYPGKPDGDPSDVRLSEARTMLGQWADQYYACRQQVIDASKLKPVLPRPVEEPRGFFSKLNPF